jgi:alpha-1,2-mannosyltransferase
MTTEQDTHGLDAGATRRNVATQSVIAGPIPSRDAYERTILGRLDRNWLSRPPVRIALVILLIVVMVIPSVQFSIRITEIDHAPHREGGVRYRTALGRWLPTIEMMGNPEPDDPYGEGHWLPLTPFILMCLRPPSYLGVFGAGLAWALLKLTGLGLSMWLLFRSFRCGAGFKPVGAREQTTGEPPGGASSGDDSTPVVHHSKENLCSTRSISKENPSSTPSISKENLCSTRNIQHGPLPQGRGYEVSSLPNSRGTEFDVALPIGVILMTAVFALRPVISDIQHGNINLFVLVWLALAWVSYVHNRDILCGLLIALAVATKVTPGLALVYFAYKREWRVCLAAGAGLLLAFGVLPSLWVGFRENVALHESWFNMLIRPFLVDGFAVITLENQSLYGVVLRLAELPGLVAVEHVSLLDAWTTGMENLAKPTGWAAAILRPAVSLSVVGMLAFACRTPARNRHDLRLLLEFGMVLVAMLLLSERTWKHHATFLAIPYLAIWYGVACLHWSKETGNMLVAALGLQFALIAGTTSGIWGDFLADEFLFYGAFCWGLVLCFVQSAYMIRKLTPAPPAVTVHAELAGSVSAAPPSG